MNVFLKPLSIHLIRMFKYKCVQKSKYFFLLLTMNCTTPAPHFHLTPAFLRHYRRSPKLQSVSGFQTHVVAALGVYRKDVPANCSHIRIASPCCWCVRTFRLEPSDLRAVTQRQIVFTASVEVKDLHPIHCSTFQLTFWENKVVRRFFMEGVKCNNSEGCRIPT